MNTAESYSILGLMPTASDEDVKKAYRALCKKYHPDNAGASEDDKRRYLLVNEAYNSICSGNAKRDMISVPVYADPAVQNIKRGPRIMGGSVSHHPGSSAARAERRHFEKQMQAESENRQQIEKKKLEERAAKARAQKEKEQAILNEIRMIRLAHIIHDTIAADRKKNRTDTD